MLLTHWEMFPMEHFSLFKESEMQQEQIIELEFNKLYLQEHLYQSHEHDCTPDDLTVSFDRSLIQQAREIFKQYPALFKVTFDTCMISSSCFGGKLRTELIHFYNHTHTIYSSFRNGRTGCIYELCLSDRLEILANQLSPFSVYETVDNLVN